MQNERTELTNKLKRLDIFFEKYIEEYDDKLQGSQEGNPYWKAYHEKYDEYILYENRLKDLNRKIKENILVNQ